MKLPTSVQSYHDACNYLAIEFIEKYFGKIEDVEYWWVEDNVGEVMYINDQFVDCVDMMQFMELGYTQKDIFAYLDYQVEKGMAGETIVNIRNWKKLK